MAGGGAVYFFLMAYQIKQKQNKRDPHILYIPIYCIVVRPKSQSKAHVSKKKNIALEIIQK